jgi:hypothetical protein
MEKERITPPNADLKSDAEQEAEMNEILKKWKEKNGEALKRAVLDSTITGEFKFKLND